MAQGSQLPQVDLDDSDNEDDGGHVTGLASKQLIRTPDKIPLRVEDFDEWCFEFENFMAVCNPQYTDDLNMAVDTELNAVETLEDTSSPALRKRSVLLYAILAGLSQGKAKTIVRRLRVGRNGFRAWREITHEYQPKDSNSRKLAMVTTITEAKLLRVTKNSEFPEALMKWEEKIDEYEKLDAETIFDPTLKKALLLRHAPREIAVHLQVNAEAMKTYKSMRAAIQSYLQTTGQWHIGDTGGEGPQPMDIGAIGKYTCYRCGSEKHSPQECRHYDSVCNGCGKKGTHLESLQSKRKRWAKRTRQRRW